MREFSRTKRVNQQLQQELAIVLQREIKDPRVGMVTVNDVEVSKDLNYAKVFVTFFEEDQKIIDEKLAALEKASGYIRRLVASRVKMRVMPELRFEYDSTLVDGMRMSNLVTQIVRQDEEKQQAAGGNEDAADTQDPSDEKDA
ncbi:30S ribosome-binding factor RbfA [Paraferrimonas sedimenticola]|uniref:Ribosome-binding factor A n=1 Tax=Paraferrimonas sedimenticola TaxID=375674 RepID=A0AA37VYF3_9GAMM|nr:30S ribosome-binding factor RbfA [Paraferrimonas sedimenticola]GLP97016.1 ribosome-binding factor A [Paraferrimonas sedimenticola]